MLLCIVCEKQQLPQHVSTVTGSSQKTSTGAPIISQALPAAIQIRVSTHVHDCCLQNDLFCIDALLTLNSVSHYSWLTVCCSLDVVVLIIVTVSYTPVHWQLISEFVFCMLYCEGKPDSWAPAGDTETPAAAEGHVRHHSTCNSFYSTHQSHQTIGINIVIVWSQCRFLCNCSPLWCWMNRFCKV